MSPPHDTAYGTCPLCRGEGGRSDYVLGDPGAWVACWRCRGTGVVQVDERVPETGGGA